MDVIQAPSVTELFERLPSALLPILMLTLGAGAAGAIAGLLFGSPLSRAYCWIFGAAIGAWLAPSVLLALVFTLGLGFRFPSDRIIGWSWLGVIVLGTFSGYVQSQRQNGFASASRRAAVFGLVIGLFGGVFLAVVWMLHLQRTTQAALPWLPACALIAFISLTGACVAATRHGEQRHSQGFDVLTPLPRDQA